MTAASMVEAATIYRCIDNGHLAFQDTPCASPSMNPETAHEQAQRAKREELQIRLRDLIRQKRVLTLEEQQALERISNDRRRKGTEIIPEGVEDAVRARYRDRFIELVQAIDLVEARIQRLAD